MNFTILPMFVESQFNFNSSDMWKLSNFRQIYQKLNI